MKAYLISGMNVIIQMQRHSANQKPLDGQIRHTFILFN